MKDTSISSKDIPQELIPEFMDAKIRIYQYIKTHQKCMIKDLKQFGSESNVRRSINELSGLKLIRKDKCTCGQSYILEAIK